MRQNGKRGGKVKDEFVTIQVSRKAHETVKAVAETIRQPIGRTFETWALAYARSIGVEVDG